MQNGANLNKTVKKLIIKQHIKAPKLITTQQPGNIKPKKLIINQSAPTKNLTTNQPLKAKNPASPKHEQDPLKINPRTKHQDLLFIKLAAIDCLQ